MVFLHGNVFDTLEKGIQWNISKTDTIGTRVGVRLRKVSVLWDVRLKGVDSKALGMGVSRLWHGSCGSCHLFVCVFLVVLLCVFLSFVCLCLLFVSFCVCHCFFGWAGYCLFLLFIVLKDSAGLALWPKVMHYIYLFLYYNFFLS